MSFRLVAKSVTLNDLERRNGVILRYFSEFGYLPGVLRKSSRSLSHLLTSSCFMFLLTYTGRTVDRMNIVNGSYVFSRKVGPFWG